MSTLLHGHPLNIGTLGVTGTDSANFICGQADVILAIGTRLQDFTTGSWTLFKQNARLIGLNAARFDAGKHMALPIVGDALEGIRALDAALGGWRADSRWKVLAREAKERWNARAEISTTTPQRLPSYAQVIEAVNHLCADEDRIVTAGMAACRPKSRRIGSARSIASVDIEFGYSCMGYEIAGGWGARIALMELQGHGDTIVLVGDGSYLLLNSDIYSSVLSGRKLIIVVCDNGGFAVIDKLQRNTGNASFNNQIADCKWERAPFAVDFAMHARSMGAGSELVRDMAAFETAFARAKSSDRTYVIEIKVDARAWTEGGHSWWEVGMPQVSSRPEVLAAAADMDAGRERQRRGV